MRILTLKYKKIRGNWDAPLGLLPPLEERGVTIIVFLKEDFLQS
jgi:hypothetical protein